MGPTKTRSDKRLLTKCAYKYTWITCKTLILGMQRTGLPGEGRGKGRRVRAQLAEIKRWAYSALGAPLNLPSRVCRAPKGPPDTFPSRWAR